jgi:hypothetical protein
MKLHIHNKGYKRKPSSYSGKITEELKASIPVEVTPQELASLVGEQGHTAVLATMKANHAWVKYNIEQQQVLMLDFDNTEKVRQPDGTYKKVKTTGMFYNSIEEILADSYIQENSCFIYKTFSHTDDWHKFRVAFVLDKPITSLAEVESAYQYLLDKYPNADPSCKNPNRLFFGGTEYTEINFSNTLLVSSLPKTEKKQTPKLKVVEKSSVEKAKSAKPEVADGDKETWRLMKEGKKEEVAARLSVYSARVHSKVQAVRLLKSYNMSELLGIQYNPTFDLFHYEKSPSAGIFKMHGTDIYLYKCHSSSHQFTGDLIMVTAKLLNMKYMEALSYLIDVTGIEITLTEQIKDIRDQCDLFLDLLLSEDLKETYPAIHNRFWRYKTDIVAILNIFKENIYEDEQGHLRSLTWLSVRNLSMKVHGTDRKKDSISRVLNLLAYTNWIDKLDETQIPAHLLKKLKETQNANKREKRSNVFELLKLGDDFFIHLNKQCEEMKENGFTMKGFSKEYVERTNGKQVADEVYVQDKNRKISALSKKITTDIHKIAMKMLDEQGVIIEKDLLEKVQKKWKSKGFTERKYKQAVSEMLEMYGLQRKRLTKSLKEELGLSLPPKSMPTILIRTA